MERVVLKAGDASFPSQIASSPPKAHCPILPGSSIWSEPKLLMHTSTFLTPEASSEAVPESVAKVLKALPLAGSWMAVSGGRISTEKCLKGKVASTLRVTPAASVARVRMT